ncbi:MAG: VWA containing CoxE family protein, partial [Firmicutes bacterium]|nr:VWA containing CoxE family protein [Bacillota bacterium]
WYAWNQEPGIDWLRKFRRFYNKVIWLNPIKESRWHNAWGAKTISMVREVFPMYELTLNGLDKGIHKLLTN